MGRQAISPPGDAREDWTILRALSDVMGKTLPYDNLQQLRTRMIEIAPHLAAIDEIAPVEWAGFGDDGDLSNDPIVSSVESHYLTNPICRASVTMAECAAIGTASDQGTGTDG